MVSADEVVSYKASGREVNRLTISEGSGRASEVDRWTSQSGCESADGWMGEVEVLPQVASGIAIFDATCRVFTGCEDEARLRSLTGAGRSAFEAGGTVVAEFETGVTTHIFGSRLLGFRAFMRGG